MPLPALSPSTWTVSLQSLTDPSILAQLGAGCRHSPPDMDSPSLVAWFALDGLVEAKSSIYDLNQARSPLASLRISTCDPWQLHLVRGLCNDRNASGATWQQHLQCSSRSTAWAAAAHRDQHCNADTLSEVVLTPALLQPAELLLAHAPLYLIAVGSRQAGNAESIDLELVLVEEPPNTRVGALSVFGGSLLCLGVLLVLAACSRARRFRARRPSLAAASLLPIPTLRSRWPQARGGWSHRVLHRLAIGLAACCALNLWGLPQLLEEPTAARGAAAAVSVLAPIARVRESTFSVDEFLTEHVDADVPLIITLDRHGSKLSAAALRAALLGPCRHAWTASDGAQLSRVSADFLSLLEGNATLLSAAFGRVFRMAHRVNAALGAGSSRDFSMEMLANASRHSCRGMPVTSWWLRRLRRLALRLGLRDLAGFVRLTEVPLAPCYLADMAASDCEDVDQILRASGGLSQTLEDTALPAALSARNSRGAAGAHPFFYPKVNPKLHTNLFWGVPGSWSYPLHTDNANGDVLFRVLSGAKRFFIFRATASEALLPMRFLPPPYGRKVFTFDPLLHASWAGDADATAYSPPVAADSVRGAAAEAPVGWEVTLAPGEVLYMPGHLAHYAVNVGPAPTLGLCSRPWSALEWRRQMRGLSVADAY